MSRFAPLVCVVSILAFATVSDVHGQSGGLSSFVRGINWGVFVGSNVDTMLACNMNVMHGSLSDTPDTTLGTKGITMIVVDGDGTLQLPPECERMTFYPSADTTGKDSSRFCFRSTTGHFLPGPSIVSLHADTPAAFYNIQYGTGQWYQSDAMHAITSNDSFYLTLRAACTYPVGHDTDVVFRVKVYRRADSGLVCGTGVHALGPVDSATFEYRRSLFPYPSSGPTAIERSFPCLHYWQKGPYTSAYPIDATDIRVEFTGKCDMDLYSVTLENATAHTFFTTDTATLYPVIRTRVAAIPAALRSSIGGWYPHDEGPASTFEPLARLKILLDRAWHDARSRFSFAEIDGKLLKENIDPCIHSALILP